MYRKNILWNFCLFCFVGEVGRGRRKYNQTVAVKTSMMYVVQLREDGVQEGTVVLKIDKQGHVYDMKFEHIDGLI